jgi:hypothetical protein
VAPRLVLTLIVAAASAAALFWGLRPADRAPMATTGGVAAAPQARPATPLADTAAAAGSAPPAAASATGDVPPGVSAEQWAAIEAELASHPQPVAERERLRSYLVWSDAVRRWRDAPGDTALARRVDAGLPDRIAGAEVSVPEALALKAALLPALEPDEVARTAAMQAFRDSLPRSAGPTRSEQEFQRRQASLVAAWQAQPAAQRDPAALAQQLDALRQTHFQKKETPR